MSLGSRLSTKSIDCTVWSLLVSPRDILPSRQHATLKSALQPRRFISSALPQTHSTQRLAKPDSKPESDDLTLSDVVLRANTLSDLNVSDDPNHKIVIRRIADEIKSQRRRKDKNLALKCTQEIDQEIDERLRAIQWRESLRLLIAYTKIHEDDLPQDAPDNGYKGRHGRLQYRFTQIPAARVPRPCTWSTDNFREYVAALTESSVIGPLHRQMPNADNSHLRSVTQILRQLFDNPQSNAHVSIPACNTALSFFYKISQLSEARSILSLMEDRGLLTSSESYNIVLRGSAHLKGVKNKNFEYILKQMIGRGVMPNAETWMIFYTMTDHDQAKSEIYRCMRDNGVLQDPVAIRSFLKLTIRRVLDKHFEKGRSITSLLEYLSGLDTKLWVSPDIANVILHEIGKRSPVYDAIKVLKQLEQLGMKFDEVTLNTMLHHCLPNRDHDDVIEIIYLFRERYKLLPGKMAYNTLFRQAWQSQLYNCLKVIWRYACSEGLVTHMMRRFVASSLLRDLPAKSDEQSMTRADMWEVAAGKLVVGLDLDLKSYTTFHQLSSSTALLGSSEPTTPAPSDKKNKARNKWIERFSQDIALGYRTHIRDDLDVLLRRALNLDRQWALETVSTQNSIEWMFQHSIHVELKYDVAFQPLDLSSPIMRRVTTRKTSNP
ncbi:MAG: hypothetical protein Q9195_000285 [Heterodermia aff. obscurata]